MGGHTLICSSLVVVFRNNVQLFFCVSGNNFYFPIHRTVQGKKINQQRLTHNLTVLKGIENGISKIF